MRGTEEGSPEGVSDEEVLAILARMVKQRQESARAYEEGGGGSTLPSASRRRSR